MPRGGSRDSRETFVVDTVRLRQKAVVPAAPQHGAVEFYFRDRVAYWLDETGVEHAFGGFGVTETVTLTWGDTGSISSGSYLLNDGVSSDVAGRLNFLTLAKVKHIFVTNGAASTFDITVQEHDGITYTDIVTVSLSSQRSAAFPVDVVVTPGKQLAIKITSGTASSPVVGVLLSGAI